MKAIASALVAAAFAAPPPEREVFRLYDRALSGVYRADPSCRPPSPFDHRPSFTDEAPSAALLGTLGVLRRPQAPEERIETDAFGPLPAERIYRNHTRVVHVNGREHVIVPAEKRRRDPWPARCLAQLRRRFRASLAGGSVRFRRFALRKLERIIRTEITTDEEPPRDGVFLFERRADRFHGGGGVTAAFIRRYGMLGSHQEGRKPSVVSGLIPDGVTTVTFTYPRIDPPRRFRRALTLTVPVQDNLVSFAVGRPAEVAFRPATMVWRAADGSVVRVVRRRD